MIGNIIDLVKSERGFRITVAFMILILYGSISLVYARQVDIKDDVKDKADKETIAEMLKQTRDMLSFQQAQTQFFMMQLEDSRKRLTDVEVDTARRLSRIETDQISINQNLEKLIKSVDNLAKKVE